jgi:hypothetical protein
MFQKNYEARFERYVKYERFNQNQNDSLVDDTCGPSPAH